MASFEEQLVELESVLERLEVGGLSLEESVALFETAVRLSRACKQQLATAEERIRVVLQPQAAGEVRFQDLSVEMVEGNAEEDSGEDAEFEDEEE